MDVLEPVAEILAELARQVVAGMDRSRLAPLDGELSLRGLEGPVEILRDRWGVPHVYATSEHDVLFAQGVVHAQDRMAQMELNRRFAAGRLAEIFGAAVLPADRAARILGFARMAARDWEASDREQKSALRAYSDGVNAWLGHPDLPRPLELALAMHRPEPWSPIDCLAYGRMMSWQLTRGWAHAVVRANLVAAAGPAMAAELDVEEDPGHPVHLPRGIEVNRLPPDGAFPGSGRLRHRGIGSNAWAVSPGRTTTGGALLANDMHMPLFVPSFWYEVHLVGGGLEVSGVSLPGIPMVMAGHNGRIAWGMTLAHTDVEDAFVERFHPDDPHRYEVDGLWVPADVRREVIRVRGRPGPENLDVVTTRHGPVISDALPAVGQRLALRSTALEPSASAAAWSHLNRAGNWDDFTDALRLMETPPLNVCYADVDGNIGYRTAGKVPIRSSGDGRLPARGWTGEGEWIGFVPFDEMPHALNPAQGFIASCNHRIAPEGYPYHLGACYLNGWRARRVVEWIEEKGRLSAEDCRTLQNDVLCLPGLELVRRLEGLSSDDPDVRLALGVLRSWDGRMDADSVGAAMYGVARFALVRLMLEPTLGKTLTDRFMGTGFDPLVNQANEFYGHDTKVLLRLLDRPESEWIRGAGGREALLLAGLKQAVGYLGRRLGPEPSEWRWGRIHGAVFSHALGSVPALAAVFNLGPFPVGGDTDTANQTAMMPDAPYEARAWAPTFKQVIDLSDLSRSVIIHAPGQSGQPASPHYSDLLEPWLRGELHPMLWTRSQVQTHTLNRQWLRPS
jgi:penicillin amidase